MLVIESIERLGLLYHVFLSTLGYDLVPLVGSDADLELFPLVVSLLLY